MCFSHYLLNDPRISMWRTYNNVCEQNASLEDMETDAVTAAFRTARQQLVSLVFNFFKIKYFQ